MNVGTILQERSDPIVNPGAQSAHAHKIGGGSNFRIETTTSSLIDSECTSTKIKQDKSVYWIPQLYFQWDNGSFTSVKGDFVIYYLYSDKKGATTPFPEDLHMFSGTPSLRTYDKTDPAQQAVTFLCLDFEGETSHHDGIPEKVCPSGIRSQINFPSCWNGKDTDSADFKSHMAFPSGGPDSGTCDDPDYPETVPRIFIEHYWATGDFTDDAGKAKNPTQPFVFSNGDPTGYGYHADFINGWEPDTLQKVVDECNCNPYGDPTCCADAGIFTLQDKTDCKITRTWDETVTGTLEKLPGNNPVVGEGGKVTMSDGECQSAMLSPVYVYTGDKPDKEGEIVKEATCDVGDAPSSSAEPSASEPASSTKESEPSSTKESEPSSTKDTEPSSTQEAEPSSTQDAEPSSTDAPPSSITSLPSGTGVLINDPAATSSVGGDDDDDEYEECDGEDDDEDEDCDAEDEDDGSSSAEPTASPTTSSVDATSVPAPTSEVAAPPSSDAAPSASPSAGDDDDDDYEDCGGEDDGDDESDEDASGTISETIPSSTASSEPSSAPSSSYEHHQGHHGNHHHGHHHQSGAVSSAIETSSGLSEPSATASASDDVASPDATNILIGAPEPSESSSPDDPDCDANGRRNSYYNKDGTSPVSKRNAHHKRAHLNRFAAGSF